MTPPFSLKPRLLQAIERSPYRERIKRVSLFGSRARGDARADSDILYVLPDGTDLYAASERAERALWPRKHSFDLVPMQASHWTRQDSVLARRVAREGVILDDI